MILWGIPEIVKVIVYVVAGVAVQLRGGSHGGAQVSARKLRWIILLTLAILVRSEVIGVGTWVCTYEANGYQFDLVYHSFCPPTVEI